MKKPTPAEIEALINKLLPNLVPETAAAILTLQADLAAAQERIATLMEALEPFADAADLAYADDAPARTAFWGRLTFGDLQRARAAITTGARKKGD